MTETLLIRADSGPAIGDGHVARCFALAQAWRDAGGTFTFAGSIGGGRLAQRIREESGEIVPLAAGPEDPGDPEEVLSLAERIRPAWIVLDGYFFDPMYQEAVSRSDIPLLLLDDDARWPSYFATVLLNQNIGAAELPYRFPRPVETLFGTRFALLRREFRSRDARPEPDREALRVLVTLGGADPDNVTGLVLEALSRVLVRGLAITAVAGASNPHRDELRDAVRSFSGAVELLEDVPDMAALMARADVAVSAAGSTCWELCSLGVPAVAIVLAANQEGIARGLEKAGAAANLGSASKWTAESLAEAMRPLLEDPEWRRTASRNGRELVDGQGAPRVAARMREWKDRGERRCG
ncbi:MAG TPA: UDP-2,4-diacetamido-2,4,6-trideoxy-beta-L-altropyranose hydrolase [Thermoanaerobaculia bacterium]|nr:UDP-2,4-diacetamido-2,4,6-trideoxy-beta-L-altropyranose hydrolase [Thermoanaerobaculia bacterium]